MNNRVTYTIPSAAELQHAGGRRLKRIKGATMRGMLRAGIAVVTAVAILAVVAVGGASAARRGGDTITVCVHHRGGGLYRSRGRCARHDSKLKSAGAQGPQGIQGVQGPQGAQGIPGPVTTTAPSGLTQRGVFVITGDASSGTLDTSITFPLELAASPKVVEVPNGVPNPDPTHCPGSPEAPSAAPGYLCLYDEFEYNVDQRIPGEYLRVSGIDAMLGDASPFGAFLRADFVVQGSIDIDGSWAVTAP
ncbi:MAG TPA: hypothetical protein VGG90_04745 [Candidatus Dormibacteraeota bacterium]|jgi:hypothetical protein